MNFPKWVDDPELDDQGRARARLKYLIYRAATRNCGRPSLKALARKCEVDHSTLAYGLRKGKLSDSVARKLCDGAGVDEHGAALLDFEDLKFPLRITSE